MRHAPRNPAQRTVKESEWEIDAEIFDEPLDCEALAAIETSLEDDEPWQRLGDVLGRITGEAEPA